MSETDSSPLLRAGVILAACVVLLVGLGSLDASPPDEPRYTQVAEEVRAMPNGPSDWILLHLNGEPYDQKPPLYFWLAALFGAPFDRVSEAAARLPSALFGIGAVVATMLLGRRMFGGRVGVIAAALLLSTYEFARLSRRAQLDVPLLALELVALAGFWWLDRGLTTPIRGALIFHGAMGLAALTKGPPGFLIPMLSVVAFLGWEGRLRDLRKAFPWWGIVLTVGPLLAWYLGAASLAPAGYSDGAVVENLIGRFFQGTSHSRPFYYYVYQFPIVFLPWTLLLPVVYSVGRSQVFSGERGEETLRAWRFLIAVIVTSVVFFSISSGKRPHYVLPAFPFLALLCGDTVVRWFHGRVRPPAGLTALAAGGATLAGLTGALVLATTMRNPLILERFPGILDESDPGILATFGGIAVAIGALGVVTWIVMLRHRVRVPAFMGVLIGGLLLFEASIFTLGFRGIDESRSPRSISVAASAFTDPGEPIGLFRDRAMIGAIVYYAHRHVVWLEDAEDVAEFFASGGQTVMLKRKKIDRLGTPVDILSSSHSGSREWVVVRPKTPGAPAES